MKSNVQIFSHPQFGDIRVAGTFMEPLFCLGMFAMHWISRMRAVPRRH